MFDDAVPAFRFNRTRPSSHVMPAPRPRQQLKLRDNLSTAKPTAKADALPPSEVRSQAEDRKAVEADAERYLHQVQGADSQPVGTAGWLQRAGLNIRKASDAQHVEAIALAYATHVRISASLMRPAIMAELEALSGRRRTRTTTDLHLVVERFVSYGGETSAERLAARKLISRDVRAIQHLEAAKVLPSRVRALAATRGEGLHAWARQRAATRRIKVAAPGAIEARRQAKAEARQRALIHEVTFTTRRPDGRRKGRVRFRVTGVLKVEIRGLQARLRGLESRSGQGA